MASVYNSTGGYSKSSAAESLGMSKGELEAKAKAAGFKSTEEYFNSIGGESSILVNQIFEAEKLEIEREKKFVENLIKNNPFAFDEELARQSATTQYEPYYSELLNDYLTDIDYQRETIQDESKLSKDLNELTMGKLTRDYQRAFRSAQEGFAGQGMFFSGTRKATEGELGIEHTSDVTRQKLGEEHRQGGYARGLEQLDLSKQRQTRDVEREKQEAIESGILKRKSEAYSQHYTPLIQTYQRQFPTSGSALQGYLVPEFLRV